ncbi:TcmI family type II polyketide cyclase [Geodermatophilus sp. URMC 63]
MTQTTPSTSTSADPAADASTTPTEPPWANDTVEFTNTSTAPASWSSASWRPFRNVIVCRMVPGTEDKVGPVFAYYDRTTRPQDMGVVGRVLLSYEGLYLHVIERKEDPEVSGQRRGLPAFQAIAEAIAPYVTPYPSYWQNPSHSVAKQFYSWVPEGEVSPDREMTVIVQRMKPGTEEDIARVFAESDAGGLPTETGVTGRWLYSMEDVFVHLLEQDRVKAAAVRENHESMRPAFAKVMADLAPYVSPYNPETWQTPRDSVARVFHRWTAPDWTPGD